MNRAIGTITVEAKISGQYLSLRDLDNAVLALSKIITLSFADGSGDGQAQIIFDDVRKLAAAASEELDLADDTLVDAFGGLLTFTSIKAIMVCSVGLAADPVNTSPVRVGGAAADEWVGWTPVAGSKVDVKPGGAWFMAAPDAVGMPVVALSDRLKIENPSGGSDEINYTIVILGVGAAT